MRFINPGQFIHSVGRRLCSGFVRGQAAPGAGEIDFGDFRRLTPISQEFGCDRGVPVDRFYIERFLQQNATDIRGRVVEVLDNAYTKTFGGHRVDHSDVLDIDSGNNRATIVADLTAAENVPSGMFDCFILTQTLQLIFDTHAAIRTVHRTLKPGGVVLASVPGISQIDRYNCADTWCWGFTRVSICRLFETCFPRENIEVTAHGNVLAAISFLEGVATEELTPDELGSHDPCYELLITVRAEKSVVTS